jgi:1-acyl-sn-glycerol-3-phosphate acyltransferase
VRGSGRGFTQMARILSVAVTPFVRFDLPSIEERPTQVPVLFAPNHRSMFDIVVGLVGLHRMDLSAAFLVNGKYFKAGWMRRILSTIGALPVDLDGPPLQALATAWEALRDGQSVVIMAEGRVVSSEQRSEVGIGPIEPGVVMIARRAKVPIVPAALIGADDVLPPGRRLPRVRLGRRHCVLVRFGSPIVVKGRPRESVADVHTALSALVMSADTELASRRTRERRAARGNGPFVQAFRRR